MQRNNLPRSEEKEEDGLPLPFSLKKEYEKEIIGKQSYSKRIKVKKMKKHY